jgi:hypothetical protein
MQNRSAKTTQTTPPANVAHGFRYNPPTQKMPLLSKPTVPIYGYVGALQLTVRSADDRYDENLLGYARERHQALEKEIEQQVKETLGPDFEVIRVDIRQGSVTLWIVIGAVGTFFMGFSRYESFIKSVNLLVDQLKGLLRRFFSDVPGGGPTVSATGSWQPAPVITAANQVFTSSSGLDSGMIMLIYLMLSHAAMTTILLWLLVRHLK